MGEYILFHFRMSRLYRAYLKKNAVHVENAPRLCIYKTVVLEFVDLCYRQCSLILLESVGRTEEKVI
jgi:hypothetical protein